jgi:uncharacterized membrane protein YhhN
MMVSSKIPKLLWGIYIFVGLLNVVSEYFASRPGIILSKPILMPVLVLIVFFTSVGDKIKSLTTFLVLALLFSWVGDLLLMGSNILEIDWLFITGIASFLIAHLFYISIFKRYKREWVFHWPKAILFAVFWLGFNILINPHLEFATKIAVPIYSGVICVMVYQAWTTSNHMAKSRFFWIVSGAFLFFFSDLMIAFHHLLGWEISVVPMRVWIMFTYILAQGLICRGVIMRIPVFTRT